MPRRPNKHSKRSNQTRHAVANFVLHLSKNILLVDPPVKVGVYLIGVAVGSVLCDQFEVPESYFSNKRNVLNQYFVKLGWGWTLSLVSTYVALTSWVYSCGRWAAVRRHLMRMVVATVQWYFCVATFRYIEIATGICTDSEHSDFYSCKKNGKTWLGFDISGHVFLLLHNLLTISEEVKTFKDWHELERLLNDEDLQKKRRVTATDMAKAHKYHKILTPFVKVVFVAIAALSVLWDFMLMMSILYRFHTLQQKILASLVAAVCWIASYRIFYNSNIKWLPCQPGKTVFFD